MKTKYSYLSGLMSLLVMAFFAVPGLSQITIDYDTQQPSCAGFTDGAITALPAGGAEPYGFNWENGQTGPTNLGITSGSYSVTVTDANGVEAIGSVVLDQPTLLEADVTRDGGACTPNSGSLVLAINGGIPGYQINWSNGDDQPIQSGLSAGFYDVTVTDANGCSALSNGFIPQPVMGIIERNALCSNSTILRAVASGGDENYSYEWSNGATSPILTDVASGTYSVVITDGDGCATITQDLTVAGALDITASVTNQCSTGNNNSTTVTATGGTPPYIFNWSNGGTGETQTNLPVGETTVTVSDAGGCSATTVVNIGVGVEAIIKSSNGPLCFGSQTGSINGGYIGGQGPHRFLWSNGDTTLSINFVDVGIYTLTITDATGCTASITDTLEYVSGFDLTLTGNDAGCSTGGSATALAENGALPFSYLWSNGSTDPNQTGLSAGTYVVTATAGNGCMEIDSITVGGTSTIVDATINDAACSGSTDGSIIVNSVTGGAEPYTYLWSTGATTNTITNLTAGTYSLEITDANGCITDESYMVDAGVINITVDATVNDAACSGSSDGSIIINSVTGGAEPYTYSWSTGAMTTTITNLTADTYTLEITDANGCTSTESYMVNEGATNITSDATVSDVSCSDSADGSIVINNTTGGTAPYTYLWSTGATDDNITNLAPGIYSVVITDGVGCTTTENYTVNTGGTVSAGFSSATVNCTGNQVMIEVNNTSTATPGPITTSQWTIVTGGMTTNSTGGSVTFMVMSGSSATVTLLVTDANGCTDETTQTITVESISVSFPSPTVCVDEALIIDPTFDASAGYTFDYSPASLFVGPTNISNPTVNTATAGTFTAMAVVTAPNGCVETFSFDVTINDGGFTPDPSLVTFTQCDGLTLDFVNGNPQSGDYTWDFGDPNQTGATASGSTATFTYTTPGIYIITFTPTEPCLPTYSVPVTVNPAATVGFGNDLGPCAATTDVSFFSTSTAPGGIDAYSWTVAPTGVTSTDSAFTTTVTMDTDLMVTLTVTYGDGCELTTTQTISVPTFMVPPTPDTLVSCAGEAVDLYPNANPNYTYAWTPNLGDVANPSVTPMQTTTYTVTITDGNCSAEEEVTVIVPTPVTVDAGDDVDTCGEEDVTLSATTNANPATFVWSTDPSLTPVVGTDPTLTVTSGAPTTYYVQVTDANGCTSTDQVTVTDNNLGTLTVNGETILCAGETPDLTITSDDPADVLTIDWTPSIPGSEPLDTDVTYTAVVTNQFGCSETVEVPVQVNTITPQASVEPDSIFPGEVAVITLDNNQDDWVIDWEASVGTDPEDLPSTGVQPDETTTYTVTVTDANGCTGSTDVQLVVLQTACEEPFVFFPTAFTPNNDGLNDILKIEGVNIVESSFIIYNRWGEQMYQSLSIDDGWNGEYQGDPVSPDVYGYYLMITCDNGDTFTKKGNVTLLR